MECEIPAMKRLLENYGCAGQGSRYQFVKNYGRPVDEIDRAFVVRKRCLFCAAQTHGDYTNYNFSKDTKSCGKIQIITPLRSELFPDCTRV